MLWQQFKKPQDADRIIKAIQCMNKRPIRIMEICGTHTMSIAKSGIKSLLPENIRIISGPGCPVCVTAAERIDEILKLAKDRSIIIATYGDMIKVPGTVQGINLERLKALGANVQTVYSAVDGVEIAKNNPECEVVFLGIGFETTTPGTALAIETAIEQNVRNFYVFSMHKLVEPILRELISMKDFDINGFICPGHVAVILGEKRFEFLVNEYRIPSVIAGFENGDIVMAVYKLLLQICDGKVEMENLYTRAVSYEGNTRALNKIFKYFEPCDDIWRGIGMVKNSGLMLKHEFSSFDAVKKFSIKIDNNQKMGVCKCGEVVKGKLEPYECFMFDKICTPENPVGPCMVSSEGSCAAYYKYQRV